jgi:hypothetical protein
MANKKTVLSKTLNELMEIYRRNLAVVDSHRLRKYTADAGLQPDAANTLEVVPRTDHKSFKVTMGPKYKDDVYTFAYGKTGLPATPVIQAYLRGDL